MAHDLVAVAVFQAQKRQMLYLHTSSWYSLWEFTFILLMMTAFTFPNNQSQKINFIMHERNVTSYIIPRLGIMVMGIQI